MFPVCSSMKNILGKEKLNFLCNMKNKNILSSFLKDLKSPIRCQRYSKDLKLK